MGRCRRPAVDRQRKSGIHPEPGNYGLNKLREDLGVRLRHELDPDTARSAESPPQYDKIQLNYLSLHPKEKLTIVVVQREAEQNATVISDRYQRLGRLKRAAFGTRTGGDAASGR